MLPLFSFPFLLLYLLLNLIAIDGSSDRRYIVQKTNRGPVGGFIETVLERDVKVFHGIPFARPPVGELRFRPPEPFPKWDKVFNATNLPASCYQLIDTSFDRFKGVDMWNPNTNRSEDCLYLNVWQPVSPGSSSLTKAVMVWIYGGGFFSGTSTLDLYDGRILASKGDVVVVSMQYRLGALGFLYLGIPEAPGNQGLLDQNLALKWVHENINDFGGDPNRITVFGESAGACSVNLHLLSPLSRDLIKSGIMQSASAIVPWGVDTTEAAKTKAKSFAKSLGCFGKKDRDIIKCMQDIKPLDLINQQGKINVTTPVVPVEFMAIVDNHFLTEHPLETVKKGTFKHSSILLGVTRNEGIYFLAYDSPDHLGPNATKPVTLEVYKSIVRNILGQSQESLASESVAFEYGAPYYLRENLEYRKLLDDVSGDMHFKCPVLDVALSYAKDPSTSVYLYEFNHTTSTNPWPSWMGVMHGYEIDHVFGLPLNKTFSYHRSETVLSEHLIRYWTNFAKTGNPNKNENGTGDAKAVEWLTYKTKDRNYLLLDTENIQIKKGLRDRHCDYWREIFPKIRAAHEDGSNHGGFWNSSRRFSLSNLLQFLAISLIFVLV